MNNRAQVFAVYLFILTGIMCFLVLTFYNSQKNQTDNFIILPTKLLSLEDSKQIFEMQEKSIIIQSLRDSLVEKDEDGVILGYGYDFFDSIFKTKFMDMIMKPEQSSFRLFLFNDSKLGTEQISERALGDDSDARAYLGKIYSISREYNSELGDYQIRIARGPIIKSINFFNLQPNKMGFPIKIDWSFGREYVIAKNVSGDISVLNEKFILR
jgi:hypothetical protein